MFEGVDPSNIFNGIGFGRYENFSLFSTANASFTKLWDDPESSNLLRPFCTLLDSGSSHSFVNEAFAVENKLKFSYLLNPIPLKMFDGSTPSNVSKKVQMPITFSTGETHHLELFITSLDENYSLVLGYDWLA